MNKNTILLEVFAVGLMEVEPKSVVTSVVSTDDT